MTQRQSNKRRSRCEKLPVINITYLNVYGITITVVASLGFILILFVGGTYIKFFNTPPQIGAVVCTVLQNPNKARYLSLRYEFSCPLFIGPVDLS